MVVRTRRVYDEPADDDGYRVLVDRLWPRGLTKDRARVDLWLKEVVSEHDVVTLVYGAADPDHNQATVLRDLLTAP